MLQVDVDVVVRKGHKRNSSEGTLQLTTSASLHDLTSLETSDSSASRQSARRRSDLVTPADTDLCTVNKPEVLL